MIEYIIDDEYAGVRVDRYLRKKLTNIYLSDIYKMIRKGKIKINNKKIKQDTRLFEGDILQLYLNFNFIENNNSEIKFILLSDERKNELKNLIIFENEDLFIINKNSGDVIHKGSGHDISLLEEYRAYYKSNIVNFVNRIDKATSGLVIAAKNIKTARKLAELIRENKVEKKYYILASGYIDKNEFTIENYLKKVDEQVIVSETENIGFKKSISHFKRILFSEKYTLLEAKLETGRTHQLRVQLANINHSIVGDLKYGLKNNENEISIENDIMYLFSYFLNIPDINLKVELEIPKIFMNKFKI